MNMDICHAGKESGVKCPFCDSEAVYRYGRAWTGKQRFLCLLCEKQFTVGSGRVILRNKPPCPACGRAMHLYKREGEFLRLRCAGYPECKTFMKMRAGREDNELLHP
ncbi:MAG: topoisomerase DNA-binding C4 zinc finger domain-containing protein [Alphaproteobacteria bacterium]|uniref:Topoisomerase DNA-binding C4 zinc finger domain-containing protein n=1 Tax=Candidatus Nitrobium versatile TaxID=2884831 RepID=A0A953J993_9BACT|nr:topoisomerase DNA-binding C4 zinc finger domain-containing protein [Candidatus Nitrobium versatile]